MCRQLPWSESLAAPQLGPQGKQCDPRAEGRAWDLRKRPLLLVTEGSEKDSGLRQKDGGKEGRGGPGLRDRKPSPVSWYNQLSSGPGLSLALACLQCHSSTFL